MRKTLSKILIALLMIGVFLTPVNSVFAQGGGPASGTTNPPSGQSVLQFQVTDVGGQAASNTQGVPPNATPNSPDEFGCTAWPGTWFKGCLAEAIYYIIWQPIAYIMSKTGELLDFFIDYSISSDAYTNGFIDKAWGAVRDVANVFFIIALLYIALKTILDANVSSQKRMIANVIIFALLINFSLFVTKVIIDTSNVLTKVFYAQITPVDKNGVPLPADSKEPKSVSLGLIKQALDPRVMVPDIKSQLGGFFIVMFITIAMMIYVIFMFLSVSILFVSRIAGLWLAMIFSPLAFMSYALPFDIPGFGHRKWWDLLLKNAFLAPIFVFFLYIVILFGGFLKNGINNNNTSQWWGDQILGAVISLLIIFVLLKKAKDLAVEYSGELGQGITSGVKTLGAIGLAATGAGLAFAGTRAVGMSGTIGKSLASVDKRAGRLFGKEGGLVGVQKARDFLNTENLKEIGKNNRGIGGWLAKAGVRASEKAKTGSFDFRKTVLSDVLSKKTGLDLQSPEGMSFLSSKQGGLKGAQERQAEKINKDIELVTGTGMSDEQVRAWSKERQDKWDEKQAYSGLSEDEYAKKNGARPEFYNNAMDLKRSRLEGYKDDITTRTLIGSLAYEFSKSGLLNRENFATSDVYQKEHKRKAEVKAREIQGKNFDKDRFEAAYSFNNEYDEALIKEINNSKINTKKMMIGVALGVASAGALPAGGAMLGAGGAMLGYGGLQAVESVAGVEGGAQAMVIKSINKEIGQVAKTGERIVDAEDRLTKQQEALVENRSRATNLYNNQSYRTIIEVENENGTPTLDDNGHITVTRVNNDAITREVAAREARESSLKVELEAIERQLRDIKDTDADAVTRRATLNAEKQSVQGAMADIKVELSEINEIKGIKEKIDSTRDKVANTQEEIAKLKGKKDDGNGGDKK